MRVLSVSEFAGWTREAGEKEYILSTENNSGLFPFPAKMTLRMHDVILSPFTERVFFRNQNDTICFERVKEVHMYDDIDSIGTVFDLVCEVPVKDSMKTSRRKRIRFLAD
jgi:hypothetical protein